MEDKGYVSGNKIVKIYLCGEPYSGTVRNFIAPNGINHKRNRIANGYLFLNEEDYINETIIDFTPLKEYIGYPVWIYKYDAFLPYLTGDLVSVGETTIEFSPHTKIDSTVFSFYSGLEKENVEVENKNNDYLTVDLGYSDAILSSTVDSFVLLKKEENEKMENPSIIVRKNRYKKEKFVNTSITRELTQFEKDFIEKKKSEGETVIVNGNVVIVKCYGRKGVAYCHPNDQFDLLLGYQIAKNKIRLEKKHSDVENIKEDIILLEKDYKKDMEHYQNKLKEAVKETRDLKYKIKNPKIEDENEKNNNDNTEYITTWSWGGSI